jgi:hypothetical protein
MSVKTSMQARKEAAARAQADANNGDYFVPSAEYQNVPDWAVLPSGAEIILPMSGGKQQARWRDPVPGPGEVIDRRTGKPQTKQPGHQTSGVVTGTPAAAASPDPKKESQIQPPEVHEQFNDLNQPPELDPAAHQISGASNSKKEQAKEPETWSPETRFTMPPPEVHECPCDPVDWAALGTKTSVNPAGLFVQKAIYPEDSILTLYMEEARTCCESADIYLLGSILPVCARLLARRVYVDWGPKKLYPNIFELLIGTAGMRKTSAIQCANRVAWKCLPPEAFLSEKQSAEALFYEFCVDEGGCPDKLMLVEEGNALMSTWAKSEYGARVAAEFLRLYDCAELSESFMRNKSKNSGTKRAIPETSTSVVIGGTFGVATFPLQQVKEGIARRFMYGVAETLERTIYWPERLPSYRVADLFKPLLKLSGEIHMPKQGVVWDCWTAYQDKNRRSIDEATSADEVLAARLTSAPVQVLKIAIIYEACRAIHNNWKVLQEFSLEGLEKAIGFVEEHIRAAAFLDRYATRKAFQEQAEVVLAMVRRDFKAQRPDTIYVTRTELTRKFCMNTGRRGAMTIEDLYYRILPELERQGECTRILKRGKFEVYAFKTEFDA